MDGQGEEFVGEGGRQLSAERHTAVVAALYGQARRITTSGHNGTRKEYGLVASMWDDVRERALSPPKSSQLYTHRDVQQTLVREQVEILQVKMDLLEVHGSPPGTKPAGVCRILYENANGIDCRQMMHPKIVKARKIHDDLEADIVAYNEHRLNLKLKKCT